MEHDKTLASEHGNRKYAPPMYVVARVDFGRHCLAILCTRGETKYGAKQMRNAIETLLSIVGE